MSTSTVLEVYDFMVLLAKFEPIFSHNINRSFTHLLAQGRPC